MHTVYVIIINIDLFVMIYCRFNVLMLQFSFLIFDAF